MVKCMICKKNKPISKFMTWNEFERKGDPQCDQCIDNYNAEIYLRGVD